MRWPIPSDLDDTARERMLFAPAGFDPSQGKPRALSIASRGGRRVTLVCSGRSIAAGMTAIGYSQFSGTAPRITATHASDPCGRREDFAGDAGTIR
jgi:hypothetical protein